MHNRQDPIDTKVVGTSQVPAIDQHVGSLLNTSHVLLDLLAKPQVADLNAIHKLTMDLPKIQASERQSVPLEAIVVENRNSVVLVNLHSPHIMLLDTRA